MSCKKAAATRATVDQVPCHSGGLQARDEGAPGRQRFQNRPEEVRGTAAPRTQSHQSRTAFGMFFHRRQASDMLLEGCWKDALLVWDTRRVIKQKTRVLPDDLDFISICWLDRPKLPGPRRTTRNTRPLVCGRGACSSFEWGWPVHAHVAASSSTFSGTRVPCAAQSRSARW